MYYIPWPFVWGSSKGDIMLSKNINAVIMNSNETLLAALSNNIYVKEL